jgi:hypothetical protein
MNTTLKALLPALVGGVIASGAQAQMTNVPQEITGYRNIIVNMSETAPQCNLTDPEMFRKELADKLSAIGVDQSDDSYSNVELRVTAKSFGFLTNHCVTSVEMFFEAALSNDNLVTSDENLKAAIDRMKVIPIILYEDGQIGVQPQTQPSSGGKSTDTQKAVATAIGELVDRFKSRRQ